MPSDKTGYGSDDAAFHERVVLVRSGGKIDVSGPDPSRVAIEDVKKHAPYRREPIGY
jgi:hypothetical protein